MPAQRVEENATNIFLRKSKHEKRFRGRDLLSAFARKNNRGLWSENFLSVWIQTWMSTWKHWSPRKLYKKQNYTFLISKLNITKTLLNDDSMLEQIVQQCCQMDSTNVRCSQNCCPLIYFENALSPKIFSTVKFAVVLMMVTMVPHFSSTGSLSK